MEVRPESADFLQLLVATACIIAHSLSISIPSLEIRRQTIAELLASGAASALSLFRQPRTNDSIRASFASATATPESLSQLLEITKRVRVIPLDLNDESMGHLHFLQALLNLQLFWLGAPRIVDMPQLRRSLRCPRDFSPHASILGGIATLELISHLVRASFDTDSPHDYTWDPSQQWLCVESPPSPIQTRALAFEQTRGGPLVVPFPGNGAGYSRWMKIRIPRSRELQSVAGIAAYLEVKRESNCIKRL
ncbi:hypothetical protein PINS_up000565 [Pythium insidiosum]|nr:hypothetical protein PINS_up000565 [Pythium insidiosum]